MGEFAKSFRELDVYQESLALSLEVHEFAKTLPSEEKFVLADQMRRPLDRFLQIFLKLGGKGDIKRLSFRN